jgi:hypothetical protein
MRKIITAVGVNLLVLTRLIAQMSGEAIRSQFINDWERAKAYTIDYLNTMPADKYGFKTSESIRSFAQQMLHLAQSNANLIGVVAGEPNIIGERNPEESKSAQTKDSVMYHVVASYNLIINGLKKMNMASLEKK